MREIIVKLGAALALLGAACAAQAMCDARHTGPCDDFVSKSADDRNETGRFTGMGGACYAYEHRGFDGKRYTLATGRVANYVGDRFNDIISSFRVAPGCKIVAWEDRDKGGAMTAFRSDTEYVGDNWNDSISSFACRCRH